MYRKLSENHEIVYWNGRIDLDFIRQSICNANVTPSQSPIAWKILKNVLELSRNLWIYEVKQSMDQVDCLLFW